MESNEIIVYINAGKPYSIKTDSIYIVEPKFDADAPDGFQEEGTTKVIDPDAGSKTTNIVPFDYRRGTEKNKIYDTFLTMESLRLKSMFPQEDVRREVVSNLNELIVEPYERLYGKDILNPRNSEFWDNARTKIYLERAFRTSEVTDLFELYCLIMNRELAPEDFASHPSFSKNASYVISNNEEKVDVRAKRELKATEANAIFYTLLTTKKAQLLTLLEYTGLNISIEADNISTLNSLFREWLDSDQQNVELFLKNYKDLIESKSGKQELEVYANLKVLKGKGIVKHQFGKIVFDGEDIGSTLKDASKKIVQSKELREKLVSHLD